MIKFHAPRGFILIVLNDKINLYLLIINNVLMNALNNIYNYTCSVSYPIVPTRRVFLIKILKKKIINCDFIIKLFQYSIMISIYFIDRCKYLIC